MSETFAVLDGSETARKRLLSIRGEPLFYADWDNVIFIHYQTDPQELQHCVPYELDLYDGSAFVSLVAFTMRGMRPRQEDKFHTVFVSRDLLKLGGALVLALPAIGLLLLAAVAPKED